MSTVPSDLKFTETHEWVSHDSNETIIGITEHAQQLLGDMVFVELPTVGTVVSAGDEIGVVESVKAASDFYAPISGEIIAINQDVINDPALVNNDPYGAGWLVKIQPSHLEEMQSLLDTEQYQTEIEQDH